MTRPKIGKEVRINTTIRIEPRYQERLKNDFKGVQAFFDISLKLYLGSSNFLRGQFLSKLKKECKK